jgi:exodeoxyribonuclease VII small subunit
MAAIALARPGRLLSPLTPEVAGSPVKDAQRPPDFEKSLAELEALVERMEDGELSLEESLAAFEQGVRLTQDCQKALTEAQQRVQVLMQQDGGAKFLPFAGEEPEASPG